MVTRWEYKLLHVDASNTEEALNRLGADGWEIAGITKEETFMPNFWLKRPIQ